VKRLCKAVLEALHCDLDVSEHQHKQHRPPHHQQNCSPDGADLQNRASPPFRSRLRHSLSDLQSEWRTISTLDPALDRALGGGIPTGYVTEITGESGAGKTQLLLSLLLAVQLPPPHGIGRPAMYISTEAPLSTRRLSQMLSANPLFDMVEQKPSLDGIISTATPDLESQDHILTFQVPVEVQRRNIGLIVLDSVAANYRAEFERRGTAAGAGGRLGSNMGARSTELVQLGMLLHDLARKQNLAVVVSNQVADRFGGPKAPTASRRLPPASCADPASSESHRVSLARGGPPTAVPAVESPSSIAEIPPPSSMPEPPLWPPPDDLRDVRALTAPALLLDHQQRWFTGWGDDPYADFALKTPSLGLVWSTQVACRIALLKRPAYGRKKHPGDEDEKGMPTLQTWRRWMKVVFAPHVASTGQGLEGAVEFEVWMGGLRTVRRDDAE
jgi:DNA repair protein RAD57